MTRTRARFITNKTVAIQVDVMKWSASSREDIVSHMISMLIKRGLEATDGPHLSKIDKKTYLCEDIKLINAVTARTDKCIEQRYIVRYLYPIMQESPDLAAITTWGSQALTESCAVPSPGAEVPLQRISAALARTREMLFLLSRNSSMELVQLVRVLCNSVMLALLDLQLDTGTESMVLLANDIGDCINTHLFRQMSDLQKARLVDRAQFRADAFRFEMSLDKLRPVSAHDRTEGEFGCSNTYFNGQGYDLLHTRAWLIVANLLLARVLKTLLIIQMYCKISNNLIEREAAACISSDTRFMRDYIVKSPPLKGLWCESLRYCPAMLVRQYIVISDFAIAEYNLKRGDMIAISPLTFNFSTKYWENPQEFRSERPRLVKRSTSASTNDEPTFTTTLYISLWLILFEILACFELSAVEEQSHELWFLANCAAPIYVKLRPR
jgi:hypothetical protein